MVVVVRLLFSEKAMFKNNNFLTVNQPNLSKQDLANLDVSKLTALSPEVISRQATINIGTIGHVAHGKSTVVKAVSGVQTVRFKNELERNITIKLDRREVTRALQEIEAKKKSKITYYFSSKNVKESEVEKNTNSEHSLRNIDQQIEKKRGRCSLTSIHKKIKKKKKKNSELSTEIDSNDVYTVERIMDYKKNDTMFLYLIKWKNWSSLFNTWEPFEHLKGCIKVLCKFFEKSFSDSDNLIEESDKLRAKMALLSPVEESDLLNRFRDAFGWLKIPIVNKDENDILLKALVMFPEEHRDPNLVNFVEENVKILTIMDKRERQINLLKNWEIEINSISQDCTKIVVENNVDLDAPPDDFVFINDYVGNDIQIPNDPPFGCECENCNKTVKACCGSSCGEFFAYNNNKKLRVACGTPIYECNKRCKCGPDCINRVVQNGSKIRLCIFKTIKCGWGVKALERIKQGTFITAYIGEVITTQEADKRSKVYNQLGRNYLFDLDFNDKEDFPYTVDAGHLGNISHFINHSCDPNLEVFAVWINCLDPNLPTLALFSRREIRMGEELTFDYLSLSSKSSIEDDMDDDSRMLCQCNSNNCRKYLF